MEFVEPICPSPSCSIPRVLKRAKTKPSEMVGIAMESDVRHSETEGASRTKELSHLFDKLRAFYRIKSRKFPQSHVISPLPTNNTGKIM